MNSLARPSQIRIIGSDGKWYKFLVKQEKSGDLRKESRVMEFCNVVNQILRRHPEAKRRNLSIRTFGVVTWKEQAGKQKLR